MTISTAHTSEQIYYNLTSVTWYGEQTYYDGYGRPCLDMSYWDFYGDGTGMLETYTEIQGIPSGQNRVYFSWDFTDGSYSVIALAFPNGGFEYWSIDNLTSGYFASFVSELDPYYYPNTDYFYQELRAVY